MANTHFWGVCSMGFVEFYSQDYDVQRAP
jgi:hypothetical protein